MKHRATVTRRSAIGSIAAVPAALGWLGGLPAGAEEPLTIGSVMDLSGPVATLGQYAKVGADLALAQVNTGGGINGRQLNIVSLNSESKPELAASLGLQLASRSDVLALIGGNFGSTASALGSVAEKQKIPLISPTAIITDEQRRWRYMFFMIANMDDFTKAMLGYSKKAGYKRLGILRLEREYGELGSKFIHQFAPGYGMTVVAEERGADGDRDFTAQLAKIRDAKPDALIVWFANPGGSLVLKNVRQLGIDVPILAPVSMDGNTTVKLAGPAAEGLVVASQIAGGDPLDRQRAFSAQYTRTFPNAPEPNTFEALGYDCVKIAAAALKKVSPPYTREKVTEALSRLHYAGAATVLNYGPNKNIPSSETIVITQISKGKFVLAK